MRRRLFFLLPNNQQAGQLARDLGRDVAVKQKDIHAVVREQETIDGVNTVHGMSETDRYALIDWWGWRIDLGLFFVALLVFVAALIWAPNYWLAPALLVVGSLAAGLYYIMRIPQDHIRDFISSVSHGEALMMVDVKISQVHDVSRYIHRHHPEALTGGVGWHF